MDQRVGRGIALLFHDRGTRRWWVVSSTPRPHFTPGKDPVHILQEDGWAPGPVWTDGKSVPNGIWSRTVQPVVSRYADWVTQPTNRNECHEYFLGGKGGRCVGMKNLLPSCADCLEIWKPQTPGTLRACPGLYRDCFCNEEWVADWIILRFVCSFLKTSPLFLVRQTGKTITYCAWLQRKQRNRKIYSVSGNGGVIYHHDFTACKQSKCFPCARQDGVWGSRSIAPIILYLSTISK